MKGVKKGLKRIITYLNSNLSVPNDELPYYLLIIFSFFFFVIGINLFVELTEELSGEALEGYDEQIANFFASLRNPELNSIVIFITDLGDLYAYIIAMILATIFFFYKLRSWKFIFQLLGVLLLSAISNIALKKAFDRARPSEEHLVVIKTLSYPSGHAMSATAFYGFLIYLIFQIKMAKWLRVVLTVFFTLLILAIGFSRIYLGVHYPSDVAGGFIAGLIWVAFCIILFNVVDLLRKQKHGEYEENIESE